MLVFLLTPPTKMFVENITSRALWTQLHHRLLLPQDKWFGVDWREHGLACRNAVPRQGQDRAAPAAQPDLDRLDRAGACRTGRRRPK